MTTSWPACAFTPVMRPIRRGSRGSRRLSSAANNPSAASCCLRRSRVARSSPIPTGRISPARRTSRPLRIQNSHWTCRRTRCPASSGGRSTRSSWPQNHHGDRGVHLDVAHREVHHRAAPPGPRRSAPRSRRGSGGRCSRGVHRDLAHRPRTLWHAAVGGARGASGEGWRPCRRGRQGADTLVPAYHGSCRSPRQGPAGRAPWLLRRRRPGGRDGREGPGAARRPGLRAQGDRAQPVRGATPSRPAARSSSTRPTRCRRAPWSCSARTASSPAVHEEAAEREPADHRRDLPAGHQGAQRGPPVRQGGLRILLIGHEGHEEVEGTMGEAPEAITLVDGPATSVSGPVRDRQGRLAVPDDAVGGRDAGDRRRAARAVPGAASPAQRRHLLRHPEPAGRGQADRPEVRRAHRRGLGELVELRAAGRGGPAGRRGIGIPGRHGGGAAAGMVRRRRVVGLTSGASVPEILVRDVLDGCRSWDSPRSRSWMRWRSGSSSRCRRSCAGR